MRQTARRVVERNGRIEPSADRGAGASAGAPATGLSAELFTIPLASDRYLVYAPLRRAAFIANAALVDRLADIAEAGARQESSAGDELLALLRRLRIIDAAAENPPICSLRGDPQPTFVSLLLTTACNLRCSYCYASAGETPVRHMSLEVAQRGIDFVSANAKRLGLEAFEVAFHGGGEPTMNWPTLVGASRYAKARARELDLQVRITAASNGMLSDRQIDWLIGHLDGISLSFDGLPSAQNAHRPTIRGGESSARVEHSLSRFDRAGFHYGLRMTLTHDQIASLPAAIAYVCSNYMPQRIQVEPAYPMGRWRDAPAAETVAFIDAFREARAIAKSFDQTLYYSAARLEVLSNHFCAVSQDGFSLTHDGQVTACYEVFDRERPHAELFFYGRAADREDSFEFDREALERLRQTSVEHKPFCGGCFAKWHCAGDCHHRSLCGTGDIGFRGSERCHITRELIKDLILERIHAAGGLLWHEPIVDGFAEPPGGE